MKDLIFIAIIFGGGYYYFNTTSEIDREGHLKTTFELFEETKEKVGLVDERNLYNKNLVPLYNSIHTKEVKKLVQNEKLRFESYRLIREANEKLIKYISYNNINQFSNDAKDLILLEKEYLEIISSNLNLLSTILNSSNSNTMGLLFTGITNNQKLTNIGDRLRNISHDSKILINMLLTTAQEENKIF